MSEIQIALEYRMRQLEAVLRQAREALGEIEWSNHSTWQSDRARGMLAAIDAALSGAPPKGLSDERIFEMIKTDFGLPDVGTQKKLYAFARAVLREAGK